MASVYNLSGRGGFAGWQWYAFAELVIPKVVSDDFRLFIVDGIISLPIALAGFLFIPDVPETTRAFYLTQDVSVPIGTSEEN